MNPASGRILCLHGYRGSAAILREQLRPLTRGLPKSFDFHCVDAPSLSSGDYGWWHARENSLAPSRGDPGVARLQQRYVGWQRTRDFIVELFAREGPFDGILGFSQGAALAALLVGLRSPLAAPSAELPLRFGFALMVGGFLSNDDSHGELYARRSSYVLPTLHIIGRADAVVPRVVSQRLALQFPNRLVLEHDGGHVIAATPEIVSRVAELVGYRG